MSVLVDYMSVSADQDRIAVVQFGNEARIEFDLTKHLNKTSVNDAIAKIDQVGGNTNTSGGLYLMRTNVFDESSGDRPDVPNMAIVITDGKSTYDPERTIPEARLAREAGTKIYL